MSIRVGVNGFGRIGRVFFRAALEAKDIEVVGGQRPGRRQDPGPPAQARFRPRHLAPRSSAKGEAIFVNGREVRVLRAEGSRPRCPGRSSASTSWWSPPASSATPPTASKHLQAGAKKVDHHRARQGPRHHGGARRQRGDVRPGQAPHRLQRLLHHQLPGHDGQGAATTTSASSAASPRPCTPTRTTSRSTTSPTRTCGAPGRAR